MWRPEGWGPKPRKSGAPKGRAEPEKWWSVKAPLDPPRAKKKKRKRKKETKKKSTSVCLEQFLDVFAILDRHSLRSGHFLCS